MNPGQTCGTNTVQKGVWKELEPLSQLIPILTWNIWNDIFILYDIALYILHYSTVYSVCLMHWIHSIHCFFRLKKHVGFVKVLSGLGAQSLHLGLQQVELVAHLRVQQRPQLNDVTRRDTT